MLSSSGRIILPANPEIFVCLVQHESILSPLCGITFKPRSESDKFVFVRATDDIDKDTWETYLGGKTAKQETKNELGETLSLVLRSEAEMYSRKDRVGELLSELAPQGETCHFMVLTAAAAPGAMGRGKTTISKFNQQCKVH
jgi:hypothetical protein